MHLNQASGKLPAHRLFHAACQPGKHGDLPRLPYEPKEEPPERTVIGRNEDGERVSFSIGRIDSPAEERALGWAQVRKAVGWPVESQGPSSPCGICGESLSKGALVGVPVNVGPQV